VVSWLPFEAVGQAIVDVALNAETPDRALNLVHPRPVRWHMMIQSVAAELARQEVVPARLPVVSMSDWFSKLSEAAANADPKRLEQIVGALQPNVMLF
jgi:NAD dependent epimerase/dehydratase family enzyme